MPGGPGGTPGTPDGPGGTPIIPGVRDDDGDGNPDITGAPTCATACTPTGPTVGEPPGTPANPDPDDDGNTAPVPVANVVDWLVTLAGPRRVLEGGSAEFTATARGRNDVALVFGWSVTHAGTEAADFTTTPLSGAFTLAAGAVRSATFSLATNAEDEAGEEDENFSIALTITSVAGGTGMAMLDRVRLPGAVTVTITEDDPAARAVRLNTQVAMLGRAAADIIADLVRSRVNAGGGDRKSSLSIGGKSIGTASEDDFAAARGPWAANPFERELLMRENFTVRGGESMSSSAIVRGTTFQLNGGLSGTNIWGAGGGISASGDRGGATYSGDISAYHVGADLPWQDGSLAGVVLSHMSAEMNLNDAANIGRAFDSRIDTDLVAFSPFLTRQWNERTRLWATLGYAEGDAQLRETADNIVRTADSVLGIKMASAGLNFSFLEQVSFRLGASFSRAKLDGGVFADSNNLRFDTVTADTVRLTSGVEAGISIALGTVQMRPFVTADARRDTGDGDIGSAVDVGGGVEWRGERLELRLEGSGHLYGDGADEESFTVTARHTGRLAPHATFDRDRGSGGISWSSGRLSVDMALGVSAEGDFSLDNLLSGELRF